MRLQTTLSSRPLTANPSINTMGYNLSSGRFRHSVTSPNTGYNVEPRKVMKKIIDQSGAIFTLHDLRRTFITIAESLDIPVYALKRLLNHKMTQDVTAGYIVMDVERLRQPMQQITDYILKLVSVKKSLEIVDLSGQKLENA